MRAYRDRSEVVAPAYHARAELYRDAGRRGLFSGGLATIQCMYAPEFTAHSSAEKVTVR